MAPRNTGCKDLMPGAQVLEPNGIARRYVPFLFHLHDSYVKRNR
jgi:hypothetical protein